MAFVGIRLLESLTDCKFMFGVFGRERRNKTLKSYFYFRWDEMLKFLYGTHFTCFYLFQEMCCYRNDINTLCVVVIWPIPPAYSIQLWLNVKK